MIAGSSSARATPKSSSRLSADPTTLNNQVRQRLVPVVQALSGGKPQDADDLLHQIYTWLARPLPATRESVRAAVAELHMFMHDARSDALQRCEAGLIDFGDAIQRDSSPYAIYAKKVVEGLRYYLERGDAAGADNYFHAVLKALDPAPPHA